MKTLLIMMSLFTAILYYPVARRKMHIGTPVSYFCVSENKGTCSCSQSHEDFQTACKLKIRGTKIKFWLSSTEG